MILSDLRKASDADLIREVSNIIYNSIHAVTGPESANHELQGFTIQVDTMRTLRDLVDELDYRHVLKASSRLRAVSPDSTIHGETLPD